MGKNHKKWASTFVGTNPGNMCAKFQKIQTKTEGGDIFLRKSWQRTDQRRAIAVGPSGLPASEPKNKIILFLKITCFRAHGQKPQKVG